MSEPFIGEIRMFAGNFAPRGWAFCDGQLLSIAQNTALFSILGTTYGGNGQTTFALPDLRGRVPVGPGQGPGLSSITPGESSGSESVTLLISNMPAHNHSVQAQLKGTSTPAATGNPSNAVFALSRSISPYANGSANPPLDLDFNSNAVAAQSGVVGGSQPFSIRQPYLGVYYIIALEGIFPSRN
jgi:microcystin-dependent protein